MVPLWPDPNKVIESFQNLPIGKTAVSILDRIKQLVEYAESRSSTNQSIIPTCYLLIMELIELINTDCISAREGFCHLLRINIEEIQKVVIYYLKVFLQLSVLACDIENEQATQLIILEKNVHEALEFSLRSNSSILLPLIDLYVDVLERIWLLLYLARDSAKYVAFIENKGSLIDARIKNWLRIFSKENFVAEEIVIALKSIRLAFQKIISCPNHIREKIIKIKSWQKSVNLLTEVGNICKEIGDTQRAILHYENSLKFIRQCIKSENQTNPNELQGAECDVLIFLGEAYSSKKENDIAIKYYNESLIKARSISNHCGEGITYLHLGEIYSSQQKISEAIKYLDKSLQIAKTHNFLEMEGHALKELGRVNFFLGKCNVGEDQYTTSLKIFTLSENFIEVARTYGYLGNSHLLVGEILKASQNFDSCLQFSQKSKDLYCEMEAHRMLGQFYFSIGKYNDAIIYYSKALVILETNQDWTAAKGRIYQQLGNTYSKLNDGNKAIENYRLTLEIAIAFEDLELQTILYASIGNYFLVFFRDYDNAMFYFTSSAEIAKKINDPIYEGSAYAGMGNVHFFLEKYKEAIQYYRLCLVRETTRDLQDQAAMLSNLGICFAELSDFQESEKYFLESISTYSNIQNNLRDNFEWKISIFEEQVKAYVEFERVLLKQGNTEKALEISDARRSRALVARLFKNLNPKHILNIEEGTYISREKMQSLAQKLKTTFIIYSFSPLENHKKGIGAWIISFEGNIKWQLLPSSDLLEELKDSNKLFDTYPYKNPASSLSLVDRVSTLKTMKNEFQKRLKEWYKTLIAPIEKFLPSDPSQTLTIIPDKFLSQIPFACFEDENGKYLIEKYPINFAPSLTVLQLLDKSPQIFPQTFLLACNPKTPNLKDNGLKQTKTEVEDIVRLLPKSISHKILTKDAPKVGVILEEIPDARWTHLACHGMIGDKLEEKLDPHSVFEGFFKLVADEKHPNGYLYAQEIASVALKAELVFLSSCHSGRGKLQQEGTIGPNWAFLAAGALSTIASYWPVPDTPTTVKMVKIFYKHLIIEKLNKAQAIQKAILAGMAEGRENYRQWGVFFLSGLI